MGVGPWGISLCSSVHCAVPRICYVCFLLSNAAKLGAVSSHRVQMVATITCGHHHHSMTWLPFKASIGPLRNGRVRGGRRTNQPGGQLYLSIRDHVRRASSGTAICYNLLLLEALEARALLRFQIPTLEYLYTCTIRHSAPGNGPSNLGCEMCLSAP